MIHQQLILGWIVSFMADMRRNIAHRRQVVEECVYWPRTVLVLFFVFCVVSYAAVVGWQIIIESENIYLETAAALVTLLLIASVSIYIFRRYRAYRRGLNELRQAHPLSPGVDEDLSLFQLRLYLRHIHGRSVDVDALLACEGGGLSTQIIDSLVRNYTYSSKEKGSLVHVHDIELGIFRTNTVSTASSLVTSHYQDNAYGDDAGGNCDSVKCVEVSTSVVDNTSPKCFPCPMECSVCLTDFKEGDMLSELPCRHTYHRACVTEWLLSHNSCPMCKQALFVLPPLSMLYPSESVIANLDTDLPAEEIRASDSPPSAFPAAARTGTLVSQQLPTVTAPPPPFEQQPLGVLELEDV